jgi:protein phosphatase
VGVAPGVEVDAERVDVELREGDTLMLCTDGLHGLVEDDELAAAASGADLDDACRRLVTLARERGGPDNITLILARVKPGDQPTISTALAAGARPPNGPAQEA